MEKATEAAASNVVQRIVSAGVSVGIFSFWVKCDIATAGYLVEYSMCRLYEAFPQVDEIVATCLGGTRDVETREGSLLVQLTCSTEEMFMNVWLDYKSGRMKKRLEDEFARRKIGVEGLNIGIKNMKEVMETITRIESRTSIPTGNEQVSEGCDESRYEDEVRQDRINENRSAIEVSRNTIEETTQAIVAQQRFRVGLSVGIISFWVECDIATARHVVEESMGCLYNLLPERIREIVDRWLDEPRNDQKIMIREGSFLVDVKCLTKKRFKIVWHNYKSGGMKKRLEDEFSKSEIDVEGLNIGIQNMKEAIETMRTIESSTSIEIEYEEVAHGYEEIRYEDEVRQDEINEKRNPIEMYKKMEKPDDSPGTVDFFQHYPTKFLRSYGMADEKPSDAKVFCYIAPTNCEWLTHPRDAASKFAATISENMSHLAESNSEYLQSAQFNSLQEKLSPFIQSLNKLNIQNDKGEASPKDVETFLKTILTDDDQVNGFFSEMVQLGAAMYSIGIHYSVVRALATSPDLFADKTVGTSNPTKQFKADRTNPGLKKYLIATCCPSQYEGTLEKTKPSARRSLSRPLDSDDGDDDGGEPSQNIHHKENRERLPVQLDDGSEPKEPIQLPEEKYAEKEAKSKP